MHAKHLVLIHVQAFDVLVNLLLGCHPLALFTEELSLTQLHVLQRFFKLTDNLSEVFLFLLEFLSVELFPLP